MAILDDVKVALGVVDNFSDDIVTLHINTVRNYLVNAGVKADVIESAASTGVFVRGVADLWNNDSGNVGFSSAFYDMVIQLSVCEQDVTE